MSSGARQSLDHMREGFRPACRPRRPKTNGKLATGRARAERRSAVLITGRVLPSEPSIADYDALARRRSLEVVAARDHRTTRRIVGEAWTQERAGDADATGREQLGQDVLSLARRVAAERGTDAAHRLFREVAAIGTA